MAGSVRVGRRKLNAERLAYRLFVKSCPQRGGLSRGRAQTTVLSRTSVFRQDVPALQHKLTVKGAPRLAYAFKFPLDSILCRRLRADCNHRRREPFSRWAFQRRAPLARPLQK